MTKITGYPTKPSGGKLAEGDKLLEELRRFGEALFSETEAAQALGSTPERLARLLKKSESARKAFYGGRLLSVEALRRAQLKHAQTNASMALYLGRTHLDRTEQREDGDGEAFDLTGATRRLRAKLAAVAAAPDPEETDPDG